MSVLINKRGLARMLGVSIPTVSAILDRYPDFPVEVRGHVGLEWQFDPVLAQAFLASKREEEAAAASATRDALLARVHLPLEGMDEAGSTAPGPTAHERLAYARALMAEDKLAKERGELVSVSEMGAKLRPVFAGIGEFMLSLPAAMGERHNLPAAVVRDMKTRVGAELRQLHAELVELLPDDYASP